MAIAGITGVGKSYYKDRLVEKLGFEKIKIITTRPPRENEKNNEDKIFVSPEELQKMCEEGRIAYKFDMLGITYAYTKEELFSNRNTVFEMHYVTVKDMKNICPNLKTIYLLPRDINIPKDKLKQRHLLPEVEAQRLKELEEHYNLAMTDPEFLKMFDYCIYNNYDEETDKEVINLVKSLLK